VLVTRYRNALIPRKDKRGWFRKGPLRPECYSTNPRHLNAVVVPPCVSPYSIRSTFVASVAKIMFRQVPRALPPMHAAVGPLVQRRCVNMNRSVQTRMEIDNQQASQGRTEYDFDKDQWMKQMKFASMDCIMDPDIAPICYTSLAGCRKAFRRFVTMRKLNDRRPDYDPKQLQDIFVSIKKIANGRSVEALKALQRLTTHGEAARITKEVKSHMNEDFAKKSWRSLQQQDISSTYEIEVDSFTLVNPLCYYAFISDAYQSMISGGSHAPRPEGTVPEKRELSEPGRREVHRYYHLVASGQMPEFISLSGKLSALIRVVEQVKAKAEKVIIFSQYIGVQDLIHRTLSAFQISAFTVRGRDSQERRRVAMEQFTSNPCLVALVLSTKIAAYGLDFTAANHVILFDSWWNPQMDAQAIARSHRRNQMKPVVVYRLASIVEDRSVLQVQTRKVALFNCIMHEKTSRRSRPDELEDCASTEEDTDRRILWHTLKSAQLQGGFPALHSVYRYNDTVRDASPVQKGVKRERTDVEGSLLSSFTEVVPS